MYNQKSLTHHDMQLANISTQMAAVAKSLEDLKIDVRHLMKESDQAAVRAALYDRWVRILPVVFAGISGTYWLCTHLWGGH